MYHFKKKNRWLAVIGGVLSIALLGGLVFGIVKLTDESKTKSISPTFAVGSLDNLGNYKEAKDRIYTKKAFDCQGLEVSLDFDSSVKYQVFFYDGFNNYLFNTDVLTGSFKLASVATQSSVSPSLVKCARIVVTPKDDDSVNFLEVWKYSRQLTIKVNKTQKYVYNENLLNWQEPREDNYIYNATVNGNLLDTTVSHFANANLHSVLSNVMYIGDAEYVTVVAPKDCQFDFFFANKNYATIAAGQSYGNSDYFFERIDYPNSYMSVYSIPVNGEFFALAAPSSHVDGGYYAVFAR